MNLLYILPVILIVALAAVAAVHFHLIATIKELFPKHAPAPAAAGVSVTSTGNVTVHVSNSDPDVQAGSPALSAGLALGTSTLGVSVPPVNHGATPPANAGSTGSLVGQPVPGGDVPDLNGAIAIAPIVSKFAPGSRFLTNASLPYVPAKSAQAFCIAANCGNTAAAEQITGLASVVALAVVANPAETVAVGGPAYHLAGQAPGEHRAVLDHVVSLSSKFASVADIVAKYQNAPDYGTQGSGSGFSPGH